MNAWTWSLGLLGLHVWAAVWLLLVQRDWLSSALYMTWTIIATIATPIVLSNNAKEIC